MAVKMARMVTTTELPSSTASRIARPKGGRSRLASDSAAGAGGAAGAGAESLMSAS